jgi:RecB family exonuclease
MAAYAASAGAGTPGRTATAVTLAAFVGELLDHLQLITVAWTGRGSPVTGGVALIAAPAVAGAALRHVFVLGAAEGAVPARLDPGARLDFVEREVARGAGLPVTGAVQAARGQALTFDAIMRAAHESLTLTFPESGERDGQLPSPYFAALNLNPTLDAHASRVNGRKQAASLQELRRYLVASGDGRSLGGDVVLAAARHALAVESRRESAEPPDEYDGIIGEPYPTSSQPFSATSLSALGQCAFKWFAEYCLRLEEPQEAEEELSPLVRGNLYHETLRFAFEAASLHGEPTRDRVLAALPAAFARAEDTEAKDTVNWQHHRGQHLAALHRVVRAESFLPEATEVVGSETLFGYGHGRPATWRGFDVRGRIDRIDRRSGVLTLVDYKTSASKPLGVQDASGEATVDVQLPIYLEAAVPALGLVGQGEPSVAEPAARQAPSPTQVAAEYYSLTKGRVIWSTAATGEGAFDGAALDGFAERAHAALATGRYPVRPDRARRACGHCAFDPVCRVGPRVERKRSGDG